MKLITVLLIILYLSITYPVIDTLPLLDSNIEYFESTQVYKYGPFEFAKYKNSAHMPGIGILASIGYLISGVHIYTFNIVGIALGAFGIVVYMRFIKSALGEYVAVASGLLLVLAGPYIAYTSSMHRDGIAVIFVFWALRAYLNRSWWSLGMALILMTVIKETMLLLPLALCIVEMIHGAFTYIRTRKIPTLAPIVVSVIPFVVFAIWNMIVKQLGGQGWNEQAAIFSPAANYGPMYVIVHNIMTLGFLNIYFVTNMLQAYVLNFHWLYTGLCLIGGIVHVYTNRKMYQQKITQIQFGIATKRLMLIITLFLLLYITAVFGFQTYTIPRYSMIVQAFLYVGCAWSIMQIIQKNLIIGIGISLITCLVAGIGLYHSLDPVSNAYWGNFTIFGKKLYMVHRKYAGNDGIVYNAQFIELRLIRDRAIKKASEQNIPVISEDCYFIFPDQRNEKKVYEQLKFSESIQSFQCVRSI